MALESIMTIKIITNLANLSLNQTQLLSTSLLLTINALEVNTSVDPVGKVNDMT